MEREPNLLFWLVAVLLASSVIVHTVDFGSAPDLIQTGSFGRQISKGPSIRPAACPSEAGNGCASRGQYAKPDGTSCCE